MELVLVERQFDEPVKFEDIQKLEHASSWCLDAHHVRFIKSFFSRDRKRMLCLYEAPDAESVRHTQKQARVPYDRAWSCTHLQGKELNPDAISTEIVVVERLFQSPVTTEFVSNALKTAGWCLDVHRATYLESYLSGDGMRMVCVFEAPDAEAVRKANRQGQVPFSAAWTASVHSRHGL